jgi:hypothetical protein
MTDQNKDIETDEENSFTNSQESLNFFENENELQVLTNGNSKNAPKVLPNVESKLESNLELDESLITSGKRSHIPSSETISQNLQDAKQNKRTESSSSYDSEDENQNEDKNDQVYLVCDIKKEVHYKDKNNNPNSILPIKLLAKDGNYIDLILSKRDIGNYKDIFLLFNVIYLLIFLK